MKPFCEICDVISILIPIYNFDVRPLVKDLLNQAVTLEVPFEILCFDDASKSDFKKTQREIKDWDGVIYKEMPTNQGRSGIRNRLAEAAKYDYLLFMDGDSKVVKSDYLLSYIEKIHADHLIYGGRVYSKDPPYEKRFYFHWLYGTSREQVSAAIRGKQPHHAFQTNNFVIPKNIFSTIKFDESLRQYGHEDTLFGFQLKKKGIKIEHIDNPLEHIGLEQTSVFLKKTEQGIENLLKVKDIHPGVTTKLLSAFESINRLRLTKPVYWILTIFENRFLKNLNSDKASIRIFDWYKLFLILKKAKQR